MALHPRTRGQAAAVREPGAARRTRCPDFGVSTAGGWGGALLSLSWCCLMPCASPAPARGCMPVARADFPAGAQARCRSSAELCRCCRAVVTPQSTQHVPPLCRGASCHGQGWGLLWVPVAGVQGYTKEPSLLRLVPQSGPAGDTRGPAAGEGEEGAGSPRPLAAITALTSFLSSFFMLLIRPGQMAGSWGSWGGGRRWLSPTIGPQPPFPGLGGSPPSR